jgi:DNA-3-methyladenine glycosylase
VGGGGRRLIATVTPLDRDFFRRPAVEVAPELLGCVLSHETTDGLVAVRLTEVEAYEGAVDPASHAYRGRTARNAVMFGPPGHAYVYFTYGMHFCVNLVCQPAGTASAVLLRAGEVIAGPGLARSRRPAVSGASSRDLARGPARLCQALAIDRRLDGADVCDPASELRVSSLDVRDVADVGGMPDARGVPDAESAGGLGGRAGAAVRPEGGCRVRTGPRVGVRDGADVAWRFWLDGEPTVSVYRAHVPRRRAQPAGRAEQPLI